MDHRLPLASQKTRSKSSRKSQNKQLNSNRSSEILSKASDRSEIDSQTIKYDNDRDSLHRIITALTSGLDYPRLSTSLHNPTNQLTLSQMYGTLKKPA